LFIEQKLFHELGFATWFGNVWELATSYNIDLNRLSEKGDIQNAIIVSFKDHWLSEKCNLSKHPILRTYHIIKDDFIMEPYLYLVNKTKYRKAISKLRCSSHTLSIEKGRHNKPKTPLCDRKCLLCSQDQIEDEKHFVLKCPFYKEERGELYCNVVCINPDFENIDDDRKFSFLLCSSDERILTWFGKFLHLCFYKRNVAQLQTLCFDYNIRVCI